MSHSFADNKRSGNLDVGRRVYRSGSKLSTTHGYWKSRQPCTMAMSIVRTTPSCIHTQSDSIHCKGSVNRYLSILKSTKWVTLAQRGGAAEIPVDGNIIRHVFWSFKLSSFPLSH